MSDNVTIIHGKVEEITMPVDKVRHMVCTIQVWCVTSHECMHGVLVVGARC